MLICLKTLKTKITSAKKKIERAKTRPNRRAAAQQKTNQKIKTRKSKPENQDPRKNMRYTQIKQSAIKKQLESLLCDTYRITLKPRKDDLRHENFGNVSSVARRK